MASTLPTHADYVIVGGGSAGCVLASRLSEYPRHSVLLIEAGADYSPGAEPEEMADSFPRAATPAHMWPGLMVERTAGGPLRPFEQARVIGGGSSIMGMVALRGLPADFDAWRDAGATGWGWDEVLPWFRRIERDLDFGGPLHGDDGPLPVRRHPPEDWPPFSRAVAQAFHANGIGPIDDMNGPFGNGVGATPMTNSATRRISAATAYLDARTRSRTNLSIAAKRTVRHILFDGRRATGVELSDGATVTAGEVVLAAGAIHSPALLLASGIGDAARLAALGIAPVADRPGVGANLQNHPVLAVSTVLRRAATQSPSIRPPFQNCARYSSGVEGTPAGDMFVSILNRTALHPVGARIGGLMLSVYKSFSRGSVGLDPVRPGTVDVRLNLLSDPRDAERLIGAVRLTGALLAHPSVRALAGPAFIPTNGKLLQRLARGDLAARAMSRAAALAMDLPGPLRARAVAIAGMPLAPLLADEGRLRAFVHEMVVPAGHVCGTCRIGRADDREAVVDPSLAVIGVERLRVADASVMPSIVSANTNLAAVMIGEKGAASIAATGPRHREHVP